MTRLPRALAAALLAAALGCAAQRESPPASAKAQPGETQEGVEGPSGISLFNRAQEALRRQDAAAAEALLRRALGANPRLFPAYLALADLYEKAGRKAEAAGAYRRLLALRPGDARGHLGLGRLAEEAGREERAIYRYERALAADPASFLAHFRLGLIRRRRGQAEAAVHHLREAVRLAPGHRAAGYWLWQVVAERGGRDAWEADLARRLVEAGNETPVIFYRGRAARRFREGRIEEALRDARMAVEANPGWRDPRWRGVLRDLERYERALKAKKKEKGN